jgi:hypothetical protein
MRRLTLIPATAAVLGALAVAAPLASASGSAAGDLSTGWTPDVCTQVAPQGPFAVLGPYGVLGDYGPNGSKAGQPNPAADCYTHGFSLPGSNVGP